MGRKKIRRAGRDFPRPIPTVPAVEAFERPPMPVIARIQQEGRMTTVSGASAATGSAQTYSAKATGSLTSTQFLSLLTTQLQNQNPLNPTDPNEFTSELVQYGSLSQQIDMNAKLDTMSTTLSSLLTQVQMLGGETS
jgi:flagellar basal-body rod modification protein FlgD